MSQRETARWVAFVIVRNEKGEILLQQRGPGKYLAGYWDFPSGHGERGESIRDTAIRELKEEVGLLGRPEDLRLVHIEQYFVAATYINFIFELDSWSGTPSVREPDSCTGIGWFAEDRLPDRRVNGVRAAEMAGFSDELTYSVTDEHVYYDVMGLPKQDP